MTKNNQVSQQKNAPVQSYPIKSFSGEEKDYVIRAGSGVGELPVTVRTAIQAAPLTGDALRRAMHAAATAIAAGKSSGALLDVAEVAPGVYMAQVRRRGRAPDAPFKAGPWLALVSTPPLLAPVAAQPVPA